jgi:hypothetical protein
MSKDTVKPVLRPKRAKRTVENTDYASFARRILTAYARRVADGDIEALRHLVLLPTDVDAITRTAIGGLRRFGYSWSEIADRLGVTRQAAQMGYGDRSDNAGGLDRRLTDAGNGVGLSTLVAVFRDHCRGVPAASVCSGCGYRFADGDVDSDCPTNQVVRPLLRRRKHERPAALAPLTVEQIAELDVKPLRRNGSAPIEPVVAGLFDPSPFRRTAGLR